MSRIYRPFVLRPDTFFKSGILEQQRDFIHRSGIQQKTTEERKQIKDNKPSSVDRVCELTVPSLKWGTWLTYLMLHYVFIDAPDVSVLVQLECDAIKYNLCLVLHLEDFHPSEPWFESFPKPNQVLLVALFWPI